MIIDNLTAEKVAEYLAVEEQSNSELMCEVTRLIGEGWRPIGGIAIAANVQNINSNYICTTFSFHQAMVRS